MHIFEANLPRFDLQQRRVRRIDDIGRRIDQGEHRLHVDQALADIAVNHAKHIQRPKKLRQQRIKSEEHTSELQSLMRLSYAVFCLKKKNNTTTSHSRYATTRH